MMRIVLGGREASLPWLHDDGASLLVGDEVLVNRTDTEVPGVLRRVWYKVTKRRWEQVDSTACLLIYLEMLLRGTTAQVRGRLCCFFSSEIYCENTR